jgi:hypothetical protein
MCFTSAICCSRTGDGTASIPSTPLPSWTGLSESYCPERARGLRAVLRYRLRGSSGGEWTLTVADGACRVDRAGNGRVDMTLVADAEELVAAAQARAAPWLGRLARAIDWIRGPARAEETVAAITGMTSLAWADAFRRLRVGGDRAIAARLNRAFWHFWERG